MTDAIAGITKLVTSPAGMIAEARNDGKVHIAYLSGVHDNGSKCGGCQQFDRAQAATIAAHRSTSEVVQIELPLTGAAFGQFAQGMGGSFDNAGMHIGGRTFPAQTPTLFAYTVDSRGQVHVSDVVQADAAINGFGAWLSNVEQHRSTLQSAARDVGAAISGQCKATPHATANDILHGPIAIGTASGCSVKTR